MATPSRSQKLLTRLLQEQQRRQQEGKPPLSQSQLDRVAKAEGYRDFDQFSRSISYLATGQAGTKAEGDIADKMREWFGGMTFELADDLEGIFRAVRDDVPLSDMMEQIQMERQNYQTTNPAEAASMNVSGALMTPARLSPGVQLSNLATKAARAARPTSKLGQIAQGAATSSPVQGAIMGAGDTAAYSAFSGGTPDQIAKESTVGAVAGGVLGYPAQKLGELGARAYASMKGRESVSNVLESANKLYRRLGGGSGGIFDTFPELQGTPPNQRRALEFLLKQIQDGDLSIPDFQRSLSEFQNLGRGDVVTLTDLATRLVPSGKSPLYQTADVVTSNPTGSTLAARTIGQRQEKSAILDRLRNDFASTMGRQLTEDQVAAIAENAQRQSKPLYQEADPQVVFSTPNIENYLSDPYVKRAYQSQLPKFERAQKAEGMINPQPLPAEPTTPMEVRTLDAVQKAVRKQQGLDRAGQSVTEDAYDLGNLRTLQDRALSDAGDQVPVYRQARKTFAEGMGTDEFEEGMRDMTANSMTPFKVRQKFENLQDGIKRDAYKSGLVNALIRKWERNTAGSPNLAKDLRNDELVEKLRVVFPDEQEFNRFLARTQAEDQMATVSNLGAGSQTQPRQATEREMLDSSGSLAEVMTPQGFMNRFVGKMEDRVMDERREQLKRELAPLLFNQGPQNINPTLNQLSALERMQDDAMRARQYGIGAVPRATVAGPLQSLLFE
jgi:hypothetical protein